MSDLTYSWKFYVYNLLYSASYTGNLKGEVEDIELSTGLRANAGSPLGTPVSLTYSFQAGPRPGVSDTGNYTFDPMTEEARTKARAIFDDFSAVANISFTEIGDNQNANIKIYQRTDFLAYGGTLSGPNDTGGFVEISRRLIDPDEFDWDLRYKEWEQTFRHELGHALGLDHPASYNYPQSPPSQTYNSESNEIPFAEETNQYSVMSYLGHAQLYQPREIRWEHYSNHHQLVDGLALYDIKALQFLYGANTAPTAANNTYTFAAQNAAIRTVYDSGGTDTFDLSNQEVATKINLDEASFSSVGLLRLHAYVAQLSPRPAYLGPEPSAETRAENNISIAWDTVIENVIGSPYDDDISGNAVANNLKGLDGNDVLSGEAGNDVLSGGAGSDTLAGGEGNDQLWAGADDDAADHMTGGAGADTLGGNVGDDTLLGDAGQDVIYAGDGADHIIAGDDADRAYGGNNDDTILLGGGDDLAYGGKGTGNDAIDGGDGDDVVYAGQGDDSVVGGDGKDLLFSGAGADTVDAGSGDDTLWGGGGNDTFKGSEGADVFAFVTGNGEDTIVDFSLREDKLDLSSFNISNLVDIASVTTRAGQAGILLTLDDVTAVFLINVDLVDVSNEIMIG